MLFTPTCVVCDTAKVRFFKQITTAAVLGNEQAQLFVILQKYDFSSKSQLKLAEDKGLNSCLWYCKSTIFQANHNITWAMVRYALVVCDTAKVRFFKQITTGEQPLNLLDWLFVILQKYDFSSKSQRIEMKTAKGKVVCDTAKVRFFKQITTEPEVKAVAFQLFVILQKYDFSSKSQRLYFRSLSTNCCLWYCKSTIFQANHNWINKLNINDELFVILQKYDFSSKSQQEGVDSDWSNRCLWYCKSTIFQANHNFWNEPLNIATVVCDTAKVRFFKQITTLIAFFCTL